MHWWWVFHPDMYNTGANSALALRQVFNYNIIQMKLPFNFPSCVGLAQAMLRLTIIITN